MIYRPNFCCHCGEKVERSDWKLWTNRRFCQLCETDHQMAAIGPKLFAGLGILAGIVGLGSYLQSSSARNEADFKRGLAAGTNTVANSQPVNIDATRETSKQSQPSSANSGTSVTVAQTDTASKAGDSRQKAATEAVYYCGAMTKKGTPCSRRVKRDERCWQHTGMPAMTAAEKVRPEK